MDQSEEYANMYEHAIECQAVIAESELHSRIIKTPAKYVWVPRTDILIGVIIRECSLPLSHWRAAIGVIIETEDSYLKYKYDSLEKSALATIMDMCYHKRWNGSEWVEV